MNNKELYQIWAPSMADKWTTFAKPALFVHINEFAFLNSTIEVRNIPSDIIQLNNEQTAIIVDLPGAVGVEAGIGLAKSGFRPIPLYNGIHETKVGGLDDIVENQPIVDALVLGADVLKDLEISADAPPVFLLDHNRDKPGEYGAEVYDNRWCVDFEDLPAASYLLTNKINRVVLWTKDEMSEDLASIIQSYRDAGIEVLTYANGQFKYQGSTLGIQNMESITIKEDIRQFENARFILLLIAILAFVHLFGMFFVNEEPLLWTAPSLMWLSYLWVSESTGDFLAMVMCVVYLIFYLSSQKRRDLMRVAAVFFGIDVAAFYIYAFFFYGVGAFTEGDFLYGLLVFVPPMVLIAYLIKGVRAWKKLEGISEVSYLECLDQLDQMPSNAPDGRIRVRRSRYRGYRGYGGTGHGGYGGSCGGHGSGFGG